MLTRNCVFYRNYSISRNYSSTKGGQLYVKSCVFFINHTNTSAANCRVSPQPRDSHLRFAATAVSVERFVTSRVA